ncbi:MAG: hypothetical protein ACJ8F3_09805 [Xanthobacteraceae bacterium]
MSLVLLILGIVLALAGIATVGFGIPVNEFSLVIAGTTALAGGLVLVGLSAVVSELARVAEGLKARPPARYPPRQADADAPAHSFTPAPAASSAASRPLQDVIQTATPPLRQRNEPSVREPRPAEPYPNLPAVATHSAVEVSASAIERLRSSIPRTERPRADSSAAETEQVAVSPNGGASPPGGTNRRRLPERTDFETGGPSEEAGNAAAADTSKASRLDFLFRSRPRSGAPAQAESFDAFWPADGRAQAAAGDDQQQAAAAAYPAEPQGQFHAPVQTQARAEQAEAQGDLSPAAERLGSDEPRSSAILKSGVVDGMAYTLYADGSIEAKLPHGTVRFASIAELRAHIESNAHSPG